MLKPTNDSRLSDIEADFTSIKEAAAQLRLLVPQISKDAVEGHKANLVASQNYSLTAKINCFASVALIILFVVFLVSAGIRMDNYEKRLDRHEIAIERLSK